MIDRTNPARLQLAPEFFGNHDLAARQAAVGLPAIACTHHRRDHRGMTQRELDGDIGERHAVSVADRGDLACSGDEFRRSGTVLEVRVVRDLGLRQQPGVVHARGDHADPALQRQGKQVVKGGLIEQAVAARHHHDVDVASADELRQHRGLVHAGADRPDHPLLAQLDQRIDARRGGLVPVIVGIVEVDDVDVVDTQPLQARVERAQDPVPAEVPLPPGRGRNDEAVVVEFVGAIGGRHEQPAHFGRDHVVVARILRERTAQARLGEPESVVRRGIEVAHSSGPCRSGRIVRRGIGGLAEQIAEWRRAEPEFRQGGPTPQCSRADLVLLVE